MEWGQKGIIIGTKKLQTGLKGKDLSWYLHNIKV